MKKGSKQKSVQAAQSNTTTAAAAAAPFRGVRYECQFYKTKVCMFWEKGQCSRGDDCKYAHGNKEMNDIPNLTNTSLCKELLTTGSCTRKDCLFAHHIEDLRATKKFLKTSMCGFYRVGQCRLGDHCRHAHDESELRPADDSQVETKLQSLQIAGGRRGGGRKTRSFKNADQDLDDDLGGNFPWERTTTSPATFGATFGASWPGNAPAPFYSANSSSPTSVPRSGSSGTEEEEDLDCDGGMWARMRTMPAPNQCLVFNQGNVNFMGNVGADWLKGIPLVGTGVATGYQSTMASLGSQQPWSRQNSCNAGILQMDLDNCSTGQGDFQPQVVMVPYVLVPVPVPTGPVRHHGLAVKSGAIGGYSDQAAISAQSPFAQDMRLDMCNQLEARWLQNAMPEVYED